MKYFLHGSTWAKYPSRYHISDVDGKVLCGAKGYWMEQFDEIQFTETGVYQMKVLSGRELRPDIIRDWETGKCKKCEKAYKKIMADLQNKK
jgi:hypothetical protein